jgi:hypothetical protein
MRIIKLIKKYNNFNKRKEAKMHHTDIMEYSGNNSQAVSHFSRATNKQSVKSLLHGNMANWASTSKTKESDPKLSRYDSIKILEKT